VDIVAAKKIVFLLVKPMAKGFSLKLKFLTTEGPRGLVPVFPIYRKDRKTVTA
jgi:hypothetical protein